MTARQRKWNKILRGTLLANLIILGIQFVLGMMVNLYVQFPGSLPQGNDSVWVMKHSPLTTTHIMVGTLILVLAILAIAFAIPARNKPALWLSVLGFILTLISWGSGAAFLSYGQQNIMSMYMALGFIVSTVVYSLALSATKKASLSRNEPYSTHSTNA